eukprot:5061626-Prymnesium_polylepis.1
MHASSCNICLGCKCGCLLRGRWSLAALCSTAADARVVLSLWRLCRLWVLVWAPEACWEHDAALCSTGQSGEGLDSRPTARGDEKEPVQCSPGDQTGVQRADSQNAHGCCNPQGS